MKDLHKLALGIHKDVTNFAAVSSSNWLRIFPVTIFLFLCCKVMQILVTTSDSMWTLVQQFKGNTQMF